MNNTKVFKAPLARPKEVAELLGCSYSGILQEIRDGNIPVIAINGSNYVLVGTWEVTRPLCNFSAQTNAKLPVKLPEEPIDPMVQITVRIKESAKKELESRAEQQGVSRDQVVKDLIYNALSSTGGGEKS